MSEAGVIFSLFEFALGGRRGVRSLGIQCSLNLPKR